jgi:hypothetical protein
MRGMCERIQNAPMLIKSGLARTSLESILLSISMTKSGRMVRVTLRAQAFSAACGRSPFFLTCREKNERIDISSLHYACNFS